jgi:hypothetical protein
MASAYALQQWLPFGNEILAALCLPQTAHGSSRSKTYRLFAEPSAMTGICAKRPIGVAYFPPRLRRLRTAASPRAVTGRKHASACK